MPTFVGDIVDQVSTTTVGFMSDVITDYWLIILGVVFVGGMIGMFWRFAHRITGKR